MDGRKYTRQFGLWPCAHDANKMFAKHATEYYALWSDASSGELLSCLHVAIAALTQRRPASPLIWAQLG
jgi:hypothetical protein